MNKTAITITLIAAGTVLVASAVVGGSITNAKQKQSEDQKRAAATRSQDTERQANEQRQVESQRATNLYNCIKSATDNYTDEWKLNSYPAPTPECPDARNWYS